MSEAALKFVPLSSTLDDGFWNCLSKLKLEVFGLDDSFLDLIGFYNIGDAQGTPCLLNVDYTSLNKDFKVPPRAFLARGQLKNFNTINDFQTCDKLELITSQGNMVWEDIVSGQAVEDPSKLVKFLLLTFADLKKYHYYYWFAFPALKFKKNVETSSVWTIEEKFTQKQLSNLTESFDAFYSEHNQGFFVASLNDDENISLHQLKETDKLLQAKSQIMFCCCDPSTLPSNPGWPLRNFLMLIACKWPAVAAENVTVLCWRDRFHGGVRSVSHSLVLTVKLPAVEQSKGCPDIMGWEKNEKQKMAPRFVNLSATMDPHRLAESAVDLNLKLMRWRLLPELPLEKIAATKCLLLGSGTLGCNVARALLGWGVRHISLVDNGQVSYSNPVRQSLFTFEDSVGSGKPKAEAAAEMLRKIFPGVNATGISLSIPMPGHSVSEKLSESVKKDVESLEALIQEHDVVFLLMDTRESRWLPTVMAGCHKKLVINAALGFDTYLVMRHGVACDAAAPKSEAAACSDHVTTQKQLGCYFCNDVVAPGNSTKDRTLDQQCTVTRPGVSFLASAFAVELMISTITHPLGISCPANCDSKSPSEASSPLGFVPHQLRGFLGQFQTLMPTSEAFPQCTACSQKVLEEYRHKGFDFLLQVFNTPNYLEDLTGLTQLHFDTNLSEVWELSDDEDI